MNNIKFLIIISISIILLNACTIAEPQYTTSATIYLINETSVVIKSDDISGYVIQPGDTLIRSESLTSEYKEKPSINNYQPFANFAGRRMFKYGDDSSQCEYGLIRIENYEDRKETSPLEFEFTFRFTEEKRENSEPCTF
ncbi:hypothetical protein OAX38_02390 [Flavobacteriaceae bacterium]|jgi:hypothetical protein|nr:hypothetical protein [Flavobacteriaceae bacterium]